MKNFKIISVLIASLISINCNSQSLKIEGLVRDHKNDKIFANYILYCNNKIINEGEAKKINISLSLNNDYKLIVFKDGYETKSIAFSTYTKHVDDFCFLFDVYLTSVNKDRYTNVSVYFDKKMDSFNYIVDHYQHNTF
jgi:hypothetical protein